MNGTPAALEARTGAPKHLRAVVSADGLSSILSTACSSESASPVEASMDCGNLQRKSTEQDGVR